MNDIIQAIETRRSIRQFKPDMPRKEELQQIIEAGLYAANGRGRQGTIILAVTNKELRDRLSALNREIGGFPEGKDPFYGAPAVLIVLADKSCPTGIYDGSLFSFLSQFSKIVPIEMAYLRYAVCGCCLCIKNANCYICKPAPFSV